MRGEGFIAFGVAMARLKRALIPMVIGQEAGRMQGLLEQASDDRDQT
jgi:hypothetical protein